MSPGAVAQIIFSVIRVDVLPSPVALSVYRTFSFLFSSEMT